MRYHADVEQQQPSCSPGSITTARPCPCDREYCNGQSDRKQRLRDWAMRHPRLKATIEWTSQKQDVHIRKIRCNHQGWHWRNVYDSSDRLSEGGAYERVTEVVHLPCSIIFGHPDCTAGDPHDHVSGKCKRDRCVGLAARYGRLRPLRQGRITDRAIGARCASGKCSAPLRPSAPVMRSASGRAWCNVRSPRARTAPVMCPC